MFEAVVLGLLHLAAAAAAAGTIITNSSLVIISEGHCMPA